MVSDKLFSFLDFTADSDVESVDTLDEASATAPPLSTGEEFTTTG
jgi:hypothetical protein